MQDEPNVNFRTWGQDNISYGPMELPALVTWLKQGRVLRSTWVFSEQRGEWARAGEMIELKGLFKSTVGAPTAAATPGITPARCGASESWPTWMNGSSLPFSSTWRC